MSFKETEIGKVPKHWKVKSLSDITKIQNGYAFKSKYFSDEGNPVIKIKNVNGRIVDTNNCQLYPYELCKDLDKFIINNNDILIAMTGAGSVGRVSKFTLENKKTYYLNQRVGKIQPVQEMIDNEFLFQIISTANYESVLFDLANGSGQPNLSPDTIGLVKIPVPPLPEQKAIAHILSTLDEKIEVNNQINKTLENMAQAIFKQWFVDFEFPNEDGEPYKSSGGEMVESELGMIPRGWVVKELGDIIELHDSKRVPLSKKEREKREKIYPYYGAASLMDYVDDYIFDGVYVLLGEDGTVINENGNPILQYVWDKFWVNNHAHVVTGRDNISTNFIYVLLKNINVSGAITGAVQLKINQKNLKELKIVLPKDVTMIEEFSELINKSFERIRINSDESNMLINIRDALLPKLMSGEIRVPLKEEGEVS